MSGLRETIKKIKSVEIQGAENIAGASVQALIDHFSGKDFRKPGTFLKGFRSAAGRLEKTRPTEPLLRNSLDFIRREVGESGTPEELKERLFSSCRQVLYHYEVAGRTIADEASKLIKDGAKAFTHCHSSSVVDVFGKAREQGKEFEVYNTETRPLFQGRRTVKELAGMGVPVKHFVDSGAKMALKDCDLMLLGADAITSRGDIVNKIGSEMFAIIAERYNVPLYICADSWKFEPGTLRGGEVPMETRSRKEVWKGAPAKGVEIMNMAFEQVDHSFIKSIISDMGPSRPGDFIHLLKETYTWLLRESRPGTF